MVDQHQPAERANWSSVRPVIAAAAISVGFLAALTLLVVWLAHVDNTGPEPPLSVQFVSAVVLLILVLSVLAIVFTRLGLQDKGHAMGLPEGSVRAIIALLLIMLFFLAAIFLFSSSQEHPNGSVKRSLHGVTAERLAGIPTDEILSMSSTVVGTTTVYDVELSQPPVNTPASNDLAKQLVTVVGTLVTAVAAFYFGANSVASASAKGHAAGAEAATAAAAAAGPAPTGETATEPATVSPSPNDSATAAASIELDDAMGDLEADEAPTPTLEAPQVDDPGYDPANDEVDPNTVGESEDPGTPGAAGPPPEPTAGGATA